MHRPIIYAVAAKGQVLGCGCGKKAVHVQYGNCTLTFTEAEFVDFSMMIDEASTRLFPINSLIKPPDGDMPDSLDTAPINEYLMSEEYSGGWS